MPINEYPDTITKILEDHFHGLKMPFSLHPIATRGATKTYYYHLVLPEGSYFVKWGEKVLNEITSQLRFETHETPFAPLSFGTSEENGILVRPVLSEPDFGYNFVDQLYKKTTSLETFLKTQDEILDRVSILYTSYSPSRSKSKLFTAKLLERMSALESDPTLNTFLMKADINSLDQQALFNLPILFQGTAKLPSIKQMVEEFEVRFERIPELKNKFLVHGDMHPPNISKDDRYGIVLIDLSDLRPHEDPCWDLGKWLNHIRRLHLVVEKRETIQSDPEIIIRKTVSQIELFDYTLYPDGFEKIDEAAIKKIAAILGEDPSLIRVRTKGAEFVANVNTFRRHIRQYPKITKRLLCLIAESYIVWRNDADRYFAENSPPG